MTSVDKKLQIKGKLENLIEYLKTKFEYQMTLAHDYIEVGLTNYAEETLKCAENTRNYVLSKMQELNVLMSELGDE